MHLLIIFGSALLVFGPKKRPELGKGIGEGIYGFKLTKKADEDMPASTTATIANDQNVTQGVNRGFWHGNPVRLCSGF
jgi:sec-independent protein translocase protein TatA